MWSSLSTRLDGGGMFPRRGGLHSVDEQRRYPPVAQRWQISDMPEPPRDYDDRIDPGGDLREQVRGLPASPPFPAAWRLMGVPAETIHDAQAMPEQLRTQVANAE